MRTIQERVREGGLEYAGPEGSGLLCERRGKPVRSGRIGKGGDDDGGT